MIYDDACHLQRFIRDRTKDDSTQRLKNLKNIKFVVDKLHIQGHTEPWCLNNCHPRLFPDLEPINTVICEQINFWLGKYKYILKHSNYLRYFCNLRLKHNRLTQ